MGHRVSVRWVLAAVLTVVAYVGVVLVTGFVACGVSGCGGGGFGPAYDPPGAQVGLLVAGLSVAPFIGFLLHRRGRALTVLGVAGAVAVGSVLAMLLLGLGSDGCPADLVRVRAGPNMFSPGSPTCSAG